MEDLNRGGLSRKAIMQEVDASLKRLETDYIGKFSLDSGLWDRLTSEIQRSLPNSQMGQQHAHRGNHAYTRRPRSLRKSPLHRCLIHVGLAVQQSPVHRENERLDSIRVDAEWVWRDWTRFRSFSHRLFFLDLHNLLYREEERDMMPVCKDLGVGVIPWSPLAMGLLGGLNRQVRLTSFSLRHATHSPRSL